MRFVRTLVLALVVAALGIPVSAGAAAAAVDGAPNLEALVVGDDEFQVGGIGTLELMIQNIGSFDGRVTGADDQVLAYGYNMGGMMVEKSRSSAARRQKSQVGESWSSRLLASTSSASGRMWRSANAR